MEKIPIIDVRGKLFSEQEAIINKQKRQYSFRLYSPVSIEHTSHLVEDKNIPSKIKEMKKELRYMNVKPLFFVVYNYGFSSFAYEGN